MLDCGAKSQKSHQKKEYETETVGGQTHHGPMTFYAYEIS